MSIDRNTQAALFVRSGRSRYSPASHEQIVEAARRVIDERVPTGTPFKDPEIARTFFRDKLAGLEREVFAAAFLDTRHRLVEYVELFHGTIDGAEVHPREVVKKAISCNAAAVVFSHNHPSGDVEPSAADRAVTARLKQALALVDIRVLDHIVVGGRGSFSMMQGMGI